MHARGPDDRSCRDLEVRRVQEMDDFPADNEWIQKEQGWRDEAEQRAQQQ